MNLGDGLLFELDNGKPKLILLNHGVEKNPAKQLSMRSRAASILSPRQPSSVEEVNVEETTTRSLVGKHRDVKNFTKRPAATSIPTTTQGKSTTLTQSKTFNHHKDNNVKVRSKGKPNKYASKNGPLRSTKKVEQPQTESSVKEALPSENANLKDIVVITNQQLNSSVQTSSDDQHSSENQEAKVTSEASSVKKGEQEVKKKEGEIVNGTSSSKEKDKGPSKCLFSWLDDRESERKTSIDAKNAQWRSELDAQVALKQQQQQKRFAPERLQGEEYAESVLSVQSSVSQREQPAAIRSSLKLGDVTPIEDVMNVERKEEQRRRWLEELARQKEEVAQRKKKEKLFRNQVEDHEHWVTHFDSLQRRPPVQPAAPSAPPPVQLSGSDKGEWDPSSSLSLLWDGTSSCGAESAVGTSVDSSSGYTRASYLRTMTSLLDPAQIEERERRRLKQLEQQRVIRAQMEERRKRKQQAEAKRKKEEEEEEKRVALEREMLQRQYELETQKMKQVEKDHNDSKLQERSESSTETRKPKSSEANRPALQYKDTGVQTDDVSLFPLKAKEVKTTDVPAPSQVAAPSNNKSKGTKTEKENICLTAGDSNEPFVKTEKNRKEKKRPEWNTQRPSRRFVPASQRYPVALQKNRQESRLKRQAELLALQERTRLSRSEAPAAQNQELPLCPNTVPTRTSPTKKVESGFKTQNLGTSDGDRGRFPAVPGAQHNVQNQQSSTTPHPPLSPAMDFIPYVRTDEVFNLDPLESADTPPPHTQSEVPPKSSPPARLDPLNHPELQRNAQQQQEILRGLAQLRQGLLQRRKELETDLSRHGNEQRSPSHHM